MCQLRPLIQFSRNKLRGNGQGCIVLTITEHGIYISEGQNRGFVSKRG